MKTFFKNKYLIYVILIILGVIIGMFISLFLYNNNNNSNIRIVENQLETSYINNNFDNTSTVSEISMQDFHNIFSNSLKNKNVSDTIYFGRYFQNNSINYDKENIEWIILYKSNKNSLLLISKYILDCKPYDLQKEQSTWETCQLRTFLNNEFYNNSFSDFEKEFIMENELSNQKNNNYNTDGGNNTLDKVFLLSENQLKRYFKKSHNKTVNEQRVAFPTDYSKNKGIDLFIDKDKWNYGYAPYWLRTPGIDQSRAEIVDSNGEIFNYGEVISNIEVGVRPCIWIKY